MAKGKYHTWLEPHKLAQVTNWAANGCSNKEIAHNMGVSTSTFCDWQNRFPAFSEAIKNGHEMSIAAIENTAFKLALGLAKETQGVKVRDSSGNEKVRMVERKLPPNPTMLIFLLKNRAGYSDNPNAAPDGASAEKFLEEWRDEA